MLSWVVTVNGDRPAKGTPFCRGSVQAAAVALVVLFGCLHAFVLVPAASSVTLNHEVGTTYQYDYVATVVLTESRPDASDVSHQIAGPVEVTSVWQNPNNADENVLLVQFTPRLRVKPKGSKVLTDHSSPLDGKPHLPVALVLGDGRITEFFAASADDDEDALNLRRGVASLFQVLDKNSSPAEEVDSSGRCSVSYKLLGKKIKKIKHNCDFHNEKQFSQKNKVVGRELISKTESTYEILHDVIHSVLSEERHSLRLHSIQNAGVLIQANQKLTFLGQKPSTISVEASDIKTVIKILSKEFKAKFIQKDIVLTDTSKPCTANCKSLLDMMKEWKEGLFPKNLATVKAAASFVRIVDHCRKSTKQDISDALKATKNKKIQAALIEALIAAQTVDSYDAVLAYLPTIKDSELLERFLVALAVVPRPTTEAIQKMTKIVKDGKLESDKARITAALTLGAMTRNYCYHTNDCEDDIVLNAINFLVEKLQQCKDETCYVTYLRALRNAANPSTVKALLPLVAKGGKVAKWTLEALKAMPSSVITDEVKSELLRIFHQLILRYDSTVRVLAADLVLSSNPTENQVLQIVDGLRTLDETSTYLSARITELFNKNPDLRKIVRKILSQQTLGNYHVLSQPGISTAFTKLLSDSNESNSTYGLHLQLGQGGILKQSVFDVNVNKDDSLLHLLGFGLYAGGLQSLVGGESSDSVLPEEVEEDATAGMELVVFGVALRPYVFFVGQGELMGHVWSGTASETTPIAKGNFPLHDYSQQMALQCGLVLALKANGALSADLSGSVKVSVWNRNAHTEITAKGAMLLQNSVAVNTDFINSFSQVSVSSDASLNFITDGEFYEAPFKMCTQMDQPAFVLRYNVRKVERIPHSKHRVRRSRKVSSTVSGRSYDLHPKNSALCHLMLNR